VTRPVRHPQAKALQGHRAGFVSRIAADALDLGVVWAIGLAALLFAGVVRYLLVGPPFRTPAVPNWLAAVAEGIIAVGYLASGWSSTGRTVGKQVAGLRVLDQTGRRLSLRRALLRAALYVLFPAGLLWILVSRRNASVQDLLVGTAVFYDWTYRSPDESPPSGDAGSPSAPPGSEHSAA
jgi:uncharacterized RDD family membrane protein YckC